MRSTVEITRLVGGVSANDMDDHDLHKALLLTRRTNHNWKGICSEPTISSEFLRMRAIAFRLRGGVRGKAGYDNVDSDTSIGWL